MEFSGRLFLAAIEEDNTQRSLFRVRPLLGEEGTVPQEDIDSLEDEGFLRVVPDRAEQHSFKERMRALGQLCLIDLRSVPGEISKVRNNKNYSPKSGEMNRFVIYSDAIRDIGETELYEVVAEGRDTAASTQRYYLRRGGHIQGPFAADSAEAAAPLCCIAPDHSRLFSVTMPDERERLYYWPEVRSPEPEGAEQPEALQEIAPAPGEAPSSAPMMEQESGEENISAPNKVAELQDSVIRPMDRERDQKVAEEKMPADPVPQIVPGDRGVRLSGAPLRAGGRRAGIHRDALSLSSIVDREMRRSARPQEPSASLNDARGLRPVDNPAEQLKQALRRLWNQQDSRKQALDSFLAMDGAQQALCERLSDEPGRAMQALSQQQLNHLEAERLALVMELDKLKSSRAELLKQALSEGGREVEAFEDRREALTVAVKALEDQLQRLSGERAELLRAMEELRAGGSYAARALGEECSPEKAAKLLAGALGAAGFEIDRNDAMNLLILAMSYPQISLAAEEADDAVFAARLTARTIGAALIECEAGEEPLLLEGGDTAVFALYQGSGAAPARELPGLTELLVSDNRVLPVCRFEVRPGFAMELEPRQRLSVSRAYLEQAIEQARRELPQDAGELLSQAETALRVRLPLTLKRNVMNYIAAAQSLLDGGIAAAVDYAFACFMIPFAQYKKLDTEALRGLCGRMPKASLLL